MKFKTLAEELTEARKIEKEVAGKFKEDKLSDGTRVMTFIDSIGRVYVIRNSLENFMRFEKWDGKKANADIQKTNKKVELMDGEKAPTIKIRVDVKFEKEEEKKEKEAEIKNEEYI